MIDFVRIPERRMNILRQDKKIVDEIEKLADVNIDINEEVSIESDDSIKIMLAKNVLKAFGRGFEIDDALNLLDDSYSLEIIEIQEFSGKSRTRMTTLKGRVIGANGKTKRMIEDCAEVKVAIYGKTICIIGRWDDVQFARRAIEMILSGSLHNTVYRFLQKGR